MADKMNKDELNQPDKLQETFSGVLQYISDNRTQVYTIAGIVVTVFIIAIGWYLYRLDYESSAQKLLLKAQASTAKASVDPKVSAGMTVKLFKEVADKYPSSKAGLIARYQLGNIYYMNNNREAIKYFESVINKAPSDWDLVPLAYSGMGYCYEADKNYPKALDAFQKAVNAKEGKIFDALLSRDIARIYEAMNNKAKATEFYQKALTQTNDPGMQIMLKRKIAENG